MKRSGFALFLLAVLARPVAVSADMVVFWGERIVDRSTLAASLSRDGAGQLAVEFFCGPGLAAGNFNFNCGPWDQAKAAKLAEVTMNSFDKDKKVSPGDIFTKAGIRGCKQVY